MTDGINIYKWKGWVDWYFLTDCFKMVFFFFNFRSQEIVLERERQSEKDSQVVNLQQEPEEE